MSGEKWPAVEATPDYMPPARGVGAPVGRLARIGVEQRDELLRNAIRDARIQLDSERARARIMGPALFGSGEEVGAARAEKRWRDKWPGLAALVDHADGA